MGLKPSCIWHRYQHQSRNRLRLKHLQPWKQKPIIWYWLTVASPDFHLVEIDRQTDTITLDLHGSIIWKTLIDIRPVICTSALTRYTRVTREVKKKCATAASGRTITTGDAGVTRKLIHEFVSLRSFKNVLLHTKRCMCVCLCDSPLLKEWIA